MNKRQKKKHAKKLYKHSYYEVRRQKIMNAASRYSTGKFDIVYITDSRRMDLKHPVKVVHLGNCVPCASYTTTTKDNSKYDDGNKEVTIEFNANP